MSEVLNSTSAVCNRHWNYRYLHCNKPFHLANKAFIYNYFVIPVAAFNNFCISLHGTALNSLLAHSHNTPCLPPIFLHKLCFQFLLGFTILPREIENNTYAKILGVNKVYYGNVQVVNWRVILDLNQCICSSPLPQYSSPSHQSRHGTIRGEKLMFHFDFKRELSQ